jgi:hypothetical protein
MGGSMMKKKIVCCIDDERTIPDAVKEMVLRSHPDVSYYLLKVGYREDPSRAIDEPVDILAEIDKGLDEFGVRDEKGAVMGLSIIGVAKTIAAIQKSKADVLFVCDLALDNIIWPVEWEDVLVFQSRLDTSKHSIQWGNHRIRPGLYLLHKINAQGFKYVLTSRVPTDLGSNDMELGEPLDSSTANDTEATAKMVEKNYKRIFGLSRRWLDVAKGDRDFLKNLSDQLSAQSFRRGALHELQHIIHFGREIPNEAINICRTLLDELGVRDDDIEEARRSLRMPQPDTKAMGVVKTIAVFQRSLPRTYLFDLLDVVRHKETHEVKLNEKRVEELTELAPTVHSDLTIAISSGMLKLEEFFDECPDPSFSWSHRVELNVLGESGGKRQCIYEVEVAPKSSRNHPINLSKLMGEGTGNGNRTLRTLSHLFTGHDLRMVIVRNDFTEEISVVRSQGVQGLFIFGKRAGDNYEIRMLGRCEFDIAAA